MLDTGKVLNIALEYFEHDLKRINHLLKVYGYASTIAAGEGLDEKQRNLIEITAILHDVGIKVSEEKYNSSAGKYQEIEGPAIAERLLTGLDIEKDSLERIKFIIGHHHTYDHVDGIDYQIMIEADFLVNADEDALSKEADQKVFEQIFKTNTGSKLFENLFLFS